MKEGSRKIADEWASALRLRETFFLTLKINQSRMFSQAPLVKLIEPNAAKRSDAQRRNVEEGLKTVYSVVRKGGYVLKQVFGHIERQTSGNYHKHFSAL